MEKPEIYFLGAGGAHDIHIGNSAALLRWEGETFLMDCGFTVYPRLVEKGLIETIDAILITHLHDDHIGSLSALLYHRHFLSRLPSTPVLAGTEELRAKLRTYLVYLMGEPLERFAQILAPESYRPFIESIDTTGRHMPHMPSTAYVFKSPTRNLLYSGDIAEPVPMMREEQWLSAYQPLWIFHDITFSQARTHAYYLDLIPWLEKTQLYGYHCDPAKAPSDNPIPLVHGQFTM